MKEYPIDYFVPLTGHEHLLGRLCLNQHHRQGIIYYRVEIDIVAKESKKIWCHLTQTVETGDEDEAIEMAMQRLSDFVRNKASTL